MSGKDLCDLAGHEAADLGVGRTYDPCAEGREPRFGRARILGDSLGVARHRVAIVPVRKVLRDELLWNEPIGLEERIPSLVREARSCVAEPDRLEVFDDRPSRL